MSEIFEQGRFRRNAELLSLWLSGENDALIDRLSGEPRGASDFLDFLDQQGLRFQFIASLEGSPLRSLFDPITLAEWEKFLAERRERQAELMTELPGIDDLFRSRTIDYRLLKGPFLGERFFGGADRRRFGDLDLLIRPDRLVEADGMLVGAGFERRTTIPFSPRIATRFAHGYDYQRGRCRIDLHWAPATHPSYRIDDARLWEVAAPLNLLGRSIPVLSDESALLFLAVSFFEDLDRGAGRLKSAVDLERMLVAMDGETDWRVLLRHAEAEGLGAILASILCLTLDITGAAPRVPSLAAELGQWASGAPTDWEGRADLLESPRGRIGNKFWAWKLYDCPWPLAMAWWAISLPMRRAVYAPGRFFSGFRR